MSEIRKKCNGQTGDDGNLYLRSHRIELRVSPSELSTIRAQARDNGFSNTAQFVRQSALHRDTAEPPNAHKKALLACQYELNRIGNNINQIARHLNQGQPLDDEMHLVMLQVLEFAQQLVEEAAKAAKGTKAGAGT